MNYIGMESLHVPVLMEALLKRPALRHLVLSDNLLGTDSAELLGRILRGNQTLRSLNLNNNSLWDGGARVLARHLEENRALLSLRLERNRIGRAALDLVQAAVRAKEHTKLRSAPSPDNLPSCPLTPSASSTSAPTGSRATLATRSAPSSRRTTSPSTSSWTTASSFRPAPPWSSPRAHSLVSLSYSSMWVLRASLKIALLSSKVTSAVSSCLA